MRNLLAYRFILANAMFGCLAVGLTAHGYIWPMFETDSSYITYGIVALFLVGWLGTAGQVWRVALLLNEQKVTGARPAHPAQRDKAMAKMVWLGGVAEGLVTLGLIGTVVGFAMAISGVSEDSINQATGAQTAVVYLMQGIRVALNTTLIGGALALWQGVNVLMLHTAATSYWSDRLVEQDQPRSRS